MEKKRRVGVYLAASVVSNNPDYVEVLRDEIGLNLAVVGPIRGQKRLEKLLSL